MILATKIYYLPEHILTYAIIGFIAVGVNGLLLAVLLPLRPRIVGIAQGIGIGLIFATIWLSLSAALPAGSLLERFAYTGIPVFATEASTVCWMLKLQDRGFGGWLSCLLKIMIASAIALALGYLMYHRHLQSYRLYV